MTAYLRDNVWGLSLTVVRLLGKLQGLRPDSVSIFLCMFVSYLLVGQKLEIHTLSSAKSINYLVGLLILHDIRELRNICKSDKQLLSLCYYPFLGIHLGSSS